MNAPETRTRRPAPQQRGGGSPAGRLLVLLLVLGGIAALLAMMSRLIMPGADQAEVQPSATAVPTVSPEPTPALPAVDISSWELRLVDFDHPLGEDFVPPSLTYIADGQQVDSRVAPALNQLISDAKSAGYTVYFCSGYRDYATQLAIYQRHIDQYTGEGMTEEEARAKTLLAVQYPGCSEHQSGLCADILETSDQKMIPEIGGSGLMLWLEQNCAKYGYVVRYPKDKTNITTIEYEPWHLRYVGQEAAAYMMEHQLCLEEFLALYGAPDTAAAVSGAAG